MLQQREKYVILVTVLMVLIVVAALTIVVADYTDGFKQDFTGLYISAGDTVFYSDGEAVLGDVEFKVHNAWDLNSHYTVQVLPTGEDFFYRVADDYRWYSYLDSVEDLSEAFNVVKRGSKFTIVCQYVTMQDVLQRLYGKEVEIPTNENDTAHFKLVVTTDTGWIPERSIEITFSCELPDFELDPPHIVM